ncbi:MAG: SDR family NAD(P)-dependent oxidoreductase [Pseudomonadota bacterium]
MALKNTTNKTILITGASSGIGRHAALHLHKTGWQVIATARQESDLEELREEGVSAVHLDYADEASIAACIEHTLGFTGGRLFALFNNGAYGQTGALEDISPELLRQQFEANFFGWHSLTQKVLPIMRSQQAGRIIQCSSVLGFVAVPYRGPYQASKFALEGYTDTLRLEVEPFGIKVVSIQPGPITSAFRKNALATFERTMNPEKSAYKSDYQRHLKRLRSNARDRFELGPEAVTAALVDALEAKRPKLRYRVTVPTRAASVLSRVLPDRAMHAFLRKQGNG